MSGKSVRQIVDVNSTGVVELAQAVLAHMERQGSGEFLIIGSISGISDMRDEAVYSGTKHAVNAVMRSLRRQVAPIGVRVGSILPGTVATELWGDVDPAEVDQRASLGEVLRPKDIADIAAFCCSGPTM